MLRKTRRQCFRMWFRAEGGASTVEFALIAPVLFFGLLATTDLGLALYERMTIDHVLRAGAESAMADQGEEDILQILKTTAARNFTLSTEAESTENTLTLSADRYCACPESPGTGVACSTTCSGAQPTFVSYRLSATKTYAGMIIPSMSFSPSVQVQIR